MLVRVQPAGLLKVLDAYSNTILSIFLLRIERYKVSSLWARMIQGGDLALQAECEGFDSLRVHYLVLYNFLH